MSPSRHTHFFLQGNRAVIARRWPRVWAWLTQAPERLVLGWEEGKTPQVDGRLVCSHRDPEAEARWQLASIPTDSACVWVYGVGSGAVARLLLRRVSLERLVVVVCDAATARISLEGFDHKEWLEDPRVTWQTPGEHGEWLRSPAVFIPFDWQNALPGTQGEGLRNRIQCELDSAILNQDARRLPWLKSHIDDNAPYWQQDPDIATLAGQWQGQTVVVAAAGPTLSDHFGALATARHPVIAVGAALKPLLNARIRPDIVITLDPTPIIVHHFHADLSLLQETVLVYFPATDPWIVAHWPGPRRVACSDGILYASFLEHRPACTRLFTSGTVTHAAADLARLLGAGRVLLMGADFSFPDGKRHVAGTAHSQVAFSASESLVNGWGEPVPSQPAMKSFCHDLEVLIVRHPTIAWFQASRRGARIAGCHYPEGSDLEAFLAAPFQPANPLPVEQIRIAARKKARQRLWSETEHLLAPLERDESLSMEDGLLLVMARLHHGAREQALSLLDALLDRSPTDLAVRIRLMALRGEGLIPSEPDESLHLLRGALNWAQASGLADEEAFVTVRLARFYRHRGQLQPALTRWREVVELTGSGTERAFYQMEWADLLQQTGQVMAAETLLQEAAQVCEREGLVCGAAQARHQRFVLRMAFPDGDPPEDPDCRRKVAQVIEAFRQGRVATGNQAMVGSIDCLLKAIQAGRIQPRPPLPQVLKSVVMAQANRDWVRVADLLEFELSSFFSV
ncbi:MAG: motility associated factor glycosyltransferase family protein [Magnetococcales bacterium]|nr:motility associated factor glycosyltransferase family protein [Magnetococcales bacterium]